MPETQRSLIDALERCRQRLQRDNPASTDVRLLAGMAEYWRLAGPAELGDFDCVIADLERKT